MISTFIVLLSLVLGVGYIFAKRNSIITVKTSEPDRLGRSETTKSLNLTPLFVGIAIVIAGVIGAAVEPFTVERVDAGHVGIKVNLTGDNRGVSKYEYKTGWVVYNSWTERLYEFPTYQQTVEYPVQQIITKGGFPASIHPTFNYTLNPGNIGDMFQNLRLGIKEIEQNWLKTAIVGAVNDEANHWSVDSLFNNRGQFEAAIVAAANNRVSKYFNISGLRTNITPPEQLQNAITAKTKAIQEVQVAENERLVAIATGERMVAQARADSASRVITAAGEAEAINRKRLVLTPEYVEMIKVEKWDGKLPQVQSGNGGLLLNMTK